MIRWCTTACLALLALQITPARGADNKGGGPAASGSPNVIVIFIDDMGK